MVKFEGTPEQLNKAIKKLTAKERARLKLNLNVTEARRLINQMPLKDRVVLLRQIEEETWKKRMDTILKNIDTRRKKSKLTAKDISQEIEKARQKFYDRHH